MARPPQNEENLEYVNVGLRPSTLAPFREKQRVDGVPVALQIRRTVEEARHALPGRADVSVPLLETMFVSCGAPEEFWRQVEEMGHGNDVVVDGTLADKVTPNSFVARARGESMAEGVKSIHPDDQLLMTPFNEFDGYLEPGAIVLAILRYKTGNLACTLKEYTGKRLKANNPKFRGVDFGRDIETATVLAVCRGVLPKVFQ